MPTTTTQPYQTPSQVFQQRGLVQWWTRPSLRFGQSANGETEQGTDFALSLNTSVGSVSSGKVVYVGKGGYNDPSLGIIVQVQSASGSIYHYQHLSGSNLRVGQQIQVGDIVGTSGGVAGTFSTGPHIEVRFSTTYAPNAGVWSQHWVDPLPSILSSAGSSNAAGTGSGPTATSAALSGIPTGVNGPSFSFPQVQLSPTADVTNILWFIDEVMQIVPPWNVVNAQQDGIPSLGLTFTDPINWFEGFLFNLGADAVAIILRLILLFWGAFLGYKVLTTFIDVGAIAQNSANAALQGIKLGALLA